VAEPSRRELSIAAAIVPMVLLFLAFQAWERHAFAERQVGIYFEEVEGQIRVSGVVAGSAADRAGFEEGDVLLRLAGEHVAATADVRRLMGRHRADETVVFTVARGSEPVKLEVMPGAPFPFFDFAVVAVSALANLLIGPLAVAKRPGYLRAQLLFLLTASIAVELALPGAIYAQPWYMAVAVLLGGLQMGLELHLASVIPERQAWLKRAPWAIGAFYAIGLGSAAVVAGSLVAERFGASPWDASALYDGYSRVVYPLWAIGVLVLLGRQALTYPEARGRQQAALVAAGVLPWAVVMLLIELGILERWVAPEWMDLVWNVALLIYPLAVFLILVREARSQERILLDLTDEVQRAASVAEISRIVSADLHAACV
jgi:hypothetical protein